MLRRDHDSDGNVYEVWKQQQESSCGIASILMAKCLVARKSIDQDEWATALGVYASVVGQTLDALKPKAPAPQTFDARKFKPNATTVGNALASGGFSADQIARGLQGQGLTVKATMPTANSAPFDAGRLGEGQAAVVLVDWDKKAGDEMSGGGHFMVAARQSSYGTIVILDPWDGKVNERPNTTKYRARYGKTGTIVAVLYLSSTAPPPAE